jgi:hypothetical protein
LIATREGVEADQKPAISGFDEVQFPAVDPFEDCGCLDAGKSHRLIRGDRADVCRTLVAPVRRYRGSNA